MPGAARRPAPGAAASRLADPTWPAAEYATSSEIAEELGCPRDAVYEALHAAGVKMWAGGYGPAGQEIPPETTERVVSLYQAGRSAKNIAAELGLQVKRVNRLVDERGVKRTRSEVVAL